MAGRQKARTTRRGGRGTKGGQGKSKPKASNTRGRAKKCLEVEMTPNKSEPEPSHSSDSEPPTKTTKKEEPLMVCIY